MPRTITVEDAERNLRHILDSLGEGESVTVVDETGVPLGHVSSLPQEDLPTGDERESFMDRWDDLAQRIGEAWDGEKSAVDQLQEDRGRLDSEA